MTTLSTVARRSEPIRGVQGPIAIISPSSGTSRDAMHVNEIAQSLQLKTPSFQGQSMAAQSLQEKLFNSLASFKIYVSQIAMHLDSEWRSRLFKQLDSLIDFEEWDAGDLPPELASFATFLRMMLLIRPIVRPGMAATSNGNIVGTWTTKNDHLTIEFFPGDEMRWSVAITTDGERERAAGITSLTRLSDILQPYSPERWFKRA